MSYTAFISYSHAADNQLAPALQSALHRFAKPFYRLRAIRVFRDQTSLRLTPALWPLIQEALAVSDYFLLLASPGAAQSHWVQSEVTEWLNLHHGSPDKILLVLTDGEAVWDNAANDFDWNRTTALPPNLRGVFTAEPLYADLRWARKSTDLSLRNPQFLDAVGSLGATLHGKSKDELVGDDVRRHRLFKSVMAATIALLTLFAAAASGTAFYAIKQRNEADRQAIEARRQKDEADRQRQSALDAAERERLAAQKEEEARKNEQKQRQMAERATRNERAAKEQAEERREDAEAQRQLADERRMEAEKERNIATSRELAAAAVSQLPSDPELSLLLSLKALDHTPQPTAEAEESLRLSLLRSHLRVTYKGVSGFASSPDWKWFILSARDGVRAMAPESGRIIPLDVPKTFTAASQPAFSQNGKLALLVCHGPGQEQTSILIWEVGTWRRLDELQFHINDFLFGATFSPDSKTIIMVRNPKKGMLVWNLATRELLERDGSGVAISPDSRIIVSRGAQATHLWEAATGKKIEETDCLAAITSTSAPSFSPNSKYVVLPCADEGKYLNKTVRVLEMETGKQVTELLSRPGETSGVRFSPDSRWAVMANTDNSANILEVGTWRKVTELRGHSASIRTFAFSPDGKWLVTIGSDLTSLVWEVGTWRAVDKLRGPASRFAVFSANGKVLVTAGTEGSICVWEVGSWQLITVLRGHIKPLLGLIISPDGRQIITTHWDSTLRIWEVGTDEEVTETAGTGDAFGHPPRMMYSPDGKYAALGDNDSLVNVLEIETGHKVVLGRGIFLAFSPDGQYVFLKGADYAVEIWDARKGEKVGELRGHTNTIKEVLRDNILLNNVEDIDFSPDSRWIVTTGGRDQTMRIWEFGTWKCITVLKDRTSVSRAAFSPDGKWLITISDKAHIWHVGTWKEETALIGPSGPFDTVAFSPDGRFVVMTVGINDHVACVWEVGTWREAMRLQGHTGWVTGATFSPDSKQILTWSWDNTARVWDVETGKAIAVLDGDPEPWRADHPNHVHSASFSFDGSLIAVASGQTVRVWDTKSRRFIRILSALTPGRDTDNMPRTVNGAIFSPDRKSLLTQSNDGLTRIYKWEMFAPIEEIQAQARTRVTRDLTPLENEKYLHSVSAEK